MNNTVMKINTMDKLTFIEAYGKNTKSKQRFNRAIRTEILAGDQILELLTSVHLTRRQILRGFERRGAAQILEDIEDSIQAIRDELVEEIQFRYNLK